jgi:hypothetical protein
MRNGLHYFGIGRVWIKSHPLNAKWTRSKTRNVDVQVGHVNLIRTRGLGGYSNVVIAPAFLRDRSRGFAVLPQISRQTGASFNGIDFRAAEYCWRR